MTDQDVIEMQDQPVYSTYETSGTRPNRTIVQRHGQSVHMMTEIDDGLFVAWTTCAACLKQVTMCGCGSGPSQPAYITQWRNERAERARMAQSSPVRNQDDDEGVSVEEQPTSKPNDGLPTALDRALAAAQERLDRNLGNEDVGF